VGSSREVLSWRALEQSDLPAVTNLARWCLSADGGQPFAADPGFLAPWYRSEAETYAGWDGPELICVSSLRRLPAGAPGERRAANALTTGLVHPAWRRRRIGERAVYVVSQASKTVTPVLADPSFDLGTQRARASGP
jgi:hypothetical protein